MNNKLNKLRMPPQNIEAEKALLGAILIDNESLSKVVDIIRPDFFYDPKHELIFQSMLDLYSANSAIDVVTVSSELQKTNKIQQAGNLVYLTDLVTHVATSANIMDYAELVKEAAIRRNLINYAAKLDENARQEEKDIENVIDELETGLLSISSNTVKRDIFDTKTLLEMHMQRTDEYAKNPEALRGVPTGLGSLDKILGGLHKSDLIILAARPSVGKSAIAIDMLRHIGINEKKTAVFFSLEMPALQVFQRMLAQETGVSLWNLRMGVMKDSDYQRYNSGADKIWEAKIFIDETPGINMMQLRSKARKLMLESGLDLIIVDYLQLMQGNAKYSDNRAMEIGEISRSLKILARELNIPVIALAQLNRAVENRQDKIPQLSDLRESGSIEQDADLVMFLGRDVVPEGLDQDAVFQKIDVHIAKHRNGPIGKVTLNFRPEIQKFFDIE